MHRILRGIVYSLLMTVVSSFCMAQVATGTYPFGTFDNKGIDTVNLGNLNVHFSLPVLNKPGRGTPFTYALSYDSSVWYPSAVSGSTGWTPVQAFGWRGDTEIATGYISFSQTTQTRGNGTSACTLTTFFNFIYHDPFGSQHPFIGKTIQVDNTGGNCTQQPITSFSYLTKDGSGYTLAVTNYTTAILTSPLGAQISPPVNVASGASTFTDSNGNQITSDGTGHFTDTTGNVALTVAGVAPSNHTFTYKDTGGVSRSVQMTYAAYTVETAFGCSGVSEYGPVSTYLVDTVTYPDGSIYHFSYEPTPSPGGAGHVTGRLSGIQLPQGGWIQYTYTSNGTGESHGIVCADGSTSGLTRNLAADSGSAASNWTYTRVAGTGTSHTDIVDGLSNHLAYDFVLGVDSTTGTPAAYYETNRTVYQGPATAPAVLARQTCYNAAASPCTTTALTFPVSQIDVLETLDAIKTYGTTNKYNSYGARTEIDVYDFGSSATAKGSLLRKDTWTYANPSVVLPSAYNSYDSAGTMAAKTQYGYDQTTPSGSTGVPQHVAVTGARSNVTSVAQYSNATTSYLTTLAYKDTGSLLTSAGPNGTTTLSYDATYVYSTGVAYPTPSSTIPISSSATYDSSYSGMMSGVFDPNNRKIGFLYDSMLRPNELDYPDGGKTTLTVTSNQISQHIYQTPTVSSDTELQYDGFGRISRVATVKDSSATTWYQQDSCYDANGNLSFSSYTYQGTGLSASKVCSASASDSYTYDVLGRLKTVSRKGVESLSYAYKGRATQSTDENGVKHITQVDGLGRTAVVCEVSSNSSMPPSGSPAPASCGTDYTGTGFITTYAYDVANHKTTIMQGVQTRIFQTDWLGRITSVQEPETFAQGQSGAAQGLTTFTYAYNATGLVVTRKRPKANQASATVLTTTTTQYDTLGRITSISYTDGTPTKTFAYDASAGLTGFTQYNVKGRLSLASVSGSPGGATAFGYDQVGRIIDLNECLSSVCSTTANNKSLHYVYDDAGNMISSTDGAGVTTTYTVSIANELLTMSSSLANATNLVSNIQYGPNGTTSYKLGSNLTNVYGYDTLGRVSGGWVCSNNSTSASCGGGTPTYSFTSSWQGSQLATSFDSVLNQSSTYGYDDMNRLTSRTVSPQTPQNFTYSYDRYGNRWTQTVSGVGPQPSYNFNTATNQINGSGYVYDAAGNMIQDGGTGFHTYTYDAEGNVTKVDSGGTAQYTYDALNQRVHTSATVSGTTTIADVIFNLAGQRVSIWDGSTHSVLQEQYYWNGAGKPVAYNLASNVHYQHQDWLGTERMRTTSTGAVEGSYGSLPFGDGKASSGTDGDDYHFAQLDFDSESNTDHADFRQYSNTQGRWMSPDSFSGSYNVYDPQSLNRYIYVLNRPLSYVDPAGLGSCSVGRDGTRFCDPVGGGPDCDSDFVVCITEPIDPNNCDEDPSICFPTGGPGQPGQPGNPGRGTTSAPSKPSAFKSWLRDMKACVVDVGLATAANDLNPIPSLSAIGLLGSAQSATDSLASAAMYGAAAHSVERGLTVPLRSSIVRGLLTTSETLGKISGILTIANVLWAGVDAINAELNAKECY